MDLITVLQSSVVEDTLMIENLARKMLIKEQIKHMHVYLLMRHNSVLCYAVSK